MEAKQTANLTLYTAGYRDPEDQRRLRPEEFYGSLPEEAVVVDIRSNPYSPFAPAYTGRGVAAAVAALKPGDTTFYHIGELGNTHKDSTGKRVHPPILRDPEAGYAKLVEILEEHGAAVIFCACSLATEHDSHLRCHRFTVAEEMQRRLPGLRVVHLPVRVTDETPEQSVMEFWHMPPPNPPPEGRAFGFPSRREGLGEGS